MTADMNDAIEALTDEQADKLIDALTGKPRPGDDVVILGLACEHALRTAIAECNSKDTEFFEEQVFNSRPAQDDDQFMKACGIQSDQQ